MNINNIMIYTSYTFIIYFAIAFENTYAQAGQIKAGYGETVGIQPDVVTTQSNTNGYGLYATDGGIIHSGLGNVSTSGSSATGLFAAEPGSVIYWQGTNISTAGFRGRGIDTVRGGQVIGYGTIITAGERAHAIQAGDTNPTAGPAKVTLLSGTSVHTISNGSYGLHAYATGTISGTANIVTEGVSSFGAHAEKDSTITIDNSNIETHGLNAIGLLANTDSIMPGVDYTPGHLTATATVVKTTGDNAFGAFADVQASITLIDTTIETLGDNAIGLFANRGGTIDSKGRVSTNGNNAYGVAAGLIAVPGKTDSVKQNGSIITKGDDAYGAFAQNAAELDISGSIQTFGDASHAAVIDGAKLRIDNLSVKTEGNDALGLYAKAGATITGQGDITTQGGHAHGVVVETDSAVNLDNTTIKTYGAFAVGASVNKGAFTLANGVISTNAHGIAVADSSNVTLVNTDVESKLSTIVARFTEDNAQINLNIDGTSNLKSDNGVLLHVERDVLPAQTGAVNLVIADQSTVIGDIVDNDAKTSGYTDVTLGANVTWNGSVQGVRHFKSTGGSSRISFGEGSRLHGDFHAISSDINFHQTGASVEGNILLSHNSNVAGGSPTSAIAVAGTMIVDATSSMRGSWTVAGNLTNDGTIAPGTTVGTITVGGNFVASDSSVYEVEINAYGNNDIITIAGTATLGGHVSLITQGQESGFTVNHRYTILSAQGGFNGTTYDGLVNWNGSSPFIYVAPTLSYDLQNVYLTLARNNVLISSAGETPNERAVGRALDYGGLSGNFGRALLLQTNQKAVKSLLSQLTGEAHQSLLSALQQSSSHTRDAINDRLRDAFAEDGPVVWSRAINTNSTTKSYPEYSSLQQNSTALFVGADTTIVEDIRAGIMAGISNTDFNVDALGSSAHSNSYHIGAYGSWNYEDWRLSLGSAYSWHNISMKRSFSIFDTPQTLESEYRADSFQVFSEVGYKIKWNAITVEPFGGVAYIQTNRDSFNEDAYNSTFAVNLNGEQSSMRNTISSLGIRLQSEWQLENAMQLELYVTPEWRHSFGNQNARSLFSFNNSNSFEISGLPITRDVFAIDNALMLSLNEAVSLSVSYNGQFGKGFVENSIKGLFKIKF